MIDHTIVFEHNVWLVALAALLCTVGAWATSRFFQRMVDVRDEQCHLWLFLTALASGVTIWCTHFVAMLGYRPGATMTFAWGPTTLSLVIAVVGSAVGFWVAGGSDAGRGRPLIGGTVVGLAVASMHYVGMSAMRMPGEAMTWRAPLVIASVLLGVVPAGLGLHVARSARRHGTNLMWALFAASVLLLHFTAMGAMHVDGSMPMDMGSADLQARSALAITVAAMSFVTIGAGAVGYVIDTQSRASALERYRQLAMYDVLTGLPNRASLNEQLEREIEDHDGEVVARIGGDEFVALCRLEDGRTLQPFLDGLRRLTSAMVPVGTEVIVPRASIGAAVFPDDAADAEALVNNADLAMYRAKGDPLRDVCCYEAAVDERTRVRRGLIADLREALGRGELFLNYQVQTAVSTGEPRGFEALLRWRHPQLGLVSPAEFVPLAEDSRIIVPIGAWVLRTACLEAASWAKPYRISVNVSAVQLSEPGLIDTVREALAESGLEPGRLELEMTETAVFSDRERALTALQAIKALGVGVALDDFGVGYSSLDALRSFPIDRIKIDRSFFSGTGTPQQTVEIVQAVLSLGRTFGMSVLAEGIETDAQLALLSEAGCDEAQGYLFGRPTSPEELLLSV
jgi:EAL domain-containing protein (putative c-di-GMP-specific phosphodiesterase class I)/NO-binding membrane sensor protein with MHYT domain/GGDEF domain-containing protein